jgi:hypothetical protein
LIAIDGGTGRWMMTPVTLWSALRVAMASSIPARIDPLLEGSARTRSATPRRL